MDIQEMNKNVKMKIRQFWPKIDQSAFIFETSGYIKLLWSLGHKLPKVWELNYATLMVNTFLN